MKQTLDSGKQKIQKICDIVKSEALEPARKEAEEILEEARKIAKEIIVKAENESIAIHDRGKKEMEQQRVVFNSTLQQAARLTLEELKREIENNFFGDEIQNIVQKGTKDSSLVAKLVEAVIKAIEKEGIAADYSAYVARSISPEEINQILGDKLLNKLREKGILEGDFDGGAKVKLHDKKITLDLSDKALAELLESYAPHFRKFLFQSS